MMRQWLLILAMVMAAAWPAAAQQTVKDDVTGAADCVVLQLNGRTGFTIQVTNSFTGSVEFYASVDGSTDTAITPFNLATNVQEASTTTTGIWAGAGSFRYVAACGASWTMGTATIDIWSTVSPAGPVSSTLVRDPNSGDPYDFGPSTSVPYVFATAVLSESVKASAGSLDWIGCHLVTGVSGPALVRVYDQATAPTPASDSANIIWHWVLDDQVPAFFFAFPGGMEATTGIGLAVSENTYSDGLTSNTALTANEGACVVGYR